MGKLLCWTGLITFVSPRVIRLAGGSQEKDIHLRPLSTSSSLKLIQNSKNSLQPLQKLPTFLQGLKIRMTRYISSKGTDAVLVLCAKACLHDFTICPLTPEASSRCFFCTYNFSSCFIAVCFPFIPSTSYLFSFQLVIYRDGGH